MKDYRNIQAWQRSHKAALLIYGVTYKFPSKEMYGLTSQLRRAAVSVPTNIAEGCGRTTETELARFMDISLGSLNEIEYLLFLSSDLGYIEKKTYQGISEEVVEIRKMLTAYVKAVRKSNRQ